MNNKEPFLCFKSRLAEELIGGKLYRKRRGPQLYEPPKRLDKTLSHLPLTRERLVCHVHTKALQAANKPARAATRVETYCVECDVNLCHTGKRYCFYKYHTEPQYWL